MTGLDCGSSDGCLFNEFIRPAKFGDEWTRTDVCQGNATRVDQSGNFRWLCGKCMLPLKIIMQCVKQQVVPCGFLTVSPLPHAVACWLRTTAAVGQGAKKTRLAVENATSELRHTAAQDINRLLAEVVS